MNNLTIKRSEEARRQAHAALMEAKRRQEELLEERASMHASDVQKVESLRAQRLARGQAVSNAEAAGVKRPVPAKRKHFSTAA
jgi:hypothetical protein